MRRTSVLLIIVILFVVLASCTNAVSSTSVVLITGFEPFEKYTVNPSELVAEALNGSSVGNATIIGIILPVDFNNSVDLTIQAIEQHHPILVISLGLNARSHSIKVEKIGLNLKRYPKGDGTWSFPQRLERTGPLLRISPLHTNNIVKKNTGCKDTSTAEFFCRDLCL